MRSGLLLLIVSSLVACSSMRPLPCATGVPGSAPDNFGQVRTPAGDATAIYRGGQPSTCGQLAYLQTLGVRSILKLNDRGRVIDRSEQEEATRLGMTIQSYSFNAATIGTAGSCDSVRPALAFMNDPQNWPVYVHCSVGKDRTGYMIGLYEKVALGASSRFVLDELHRYGHSGLRSVVMRQIDRELGSEMPACAP